MIDDPSLEIDGVGHRSDLQPLRLGQEEDVAALDGVPERDDLGTQELRLEVTGLDFDRPGHEVFHGDDVVVVVIDAVEHAIDRVPVADPDVSGLLDFDVDLVEQREQPTTRVGESELTDDVDLRRRVEPRQRVESAGDVEVERRRRLWDRLGEDDVARVDPVGVGDLWVVGPQHGPGQRVVEVDRREVEQRVAVAGDVEGPRPLSDRLHLDALRYGVLRNESVDGAGDGGRGDESDRESVLHILSIGLNHSSARRRSDARVAASVVG